MQPVLAPFAHGAVALGLEKVERPEVQAGEKALGHLAIELRGLHVRLEGCLDPSLEPRPIELLTRQPEHPGARVQEPLAIEVVERRKELALGQVPERTEQRQIDFSTAGLGGPSMAGSLALCHVRPVWLTYLKIAHAA